MHSVKLSLDNLCDVVEHPLLLKGERNAVDSVLLHLVAHVATFDHGVLCSLLVDIAVGLGLILLVEFGLPLVGGGHARVCLGGSHFLIKFHY